MTRPLRERVFILLWLGVAVVWGVALFFMLRYKLGMEPEAVVWDGLQSIAAAAGLVALLQYLVLGYASPDRLFRKRGA